MMSKNKQRGLLQEPNLLPPFRTFVILWLGLVLLFLILGVFRSGQGDGVSFTWLQAGNLALLAGYLFIPALPKLLGRAYLPIAFGLATVGTLLATIIPIAFNQPDLPPEPVAQLLTFGRVFVVWTVLVVLIAWQYRLRTVLLYTAGLGVLNMGILALFFGVLPLIAVETAALSLFIALAFSIIGYLVHHLSTAERKQRQALAAANQQIAQYATTLEELTISRERNRMARELHDTLAHTLSGLSVQLETARAYWDVNEETAKQLLDQSLTATRSGLQETRRALQSLRSAPLEDLGLVLALEELGKTAVSRAGLTLNLNLPTHAPKLPPTVEQSIYRIAQEAVNNVIKHATAQTLTLTLQVNRETKLVVADDGVGFAAENVSEEGHYGLIGLRERAVLVNGTLDIASQPQQGTTITFLLEDSPSN